MFYFVVCVYLKPGQNIVHRIRLHQMPLEIITSNLKHRHHNVPWAPEKSRIKCGEVQCFITSFFFSFCLLLLVTEMLKASYGIHQQAGFPL